MDDTQLILQLLTHGQRKALRSRQLAPRTGKVAAAVVAHLSQPGHLPQPTLSVRCALAAELAKAEPWTESEWGRHPQFGLLRSWPAIALHFLVEGLPSNISLPQIAEETVRCYTPAYEVLRTTLPPAKVRGITRPYFWQSAKPEVPRENIPAGYSTSAYYTGGE